MLCNLGLCYMIVVYRYSALSKLTQLITSGLHVLACIHYMQIALYLYPLPAVWTLCLIEVVSVPLLAPCLSPTIRLPW